MPSAHQPLTASVAASSTPTAATGSTPAAICPASSHTFSGPVCVLSVTPG
jgi:hypothetical protein